MLLAGLALAAAAASAESGARLEADIEPQPLSEALHAFGRQTGLQIIYVSAIAETLRSPGARAGLEARAALQHLLEGSGLQFDFLNERTVRIFAAPAPMRSAPPPPPARAAGQPRPVVEEVVVTATRREEPASKVPIDMVTWTQQAMESSGIKGIAELADLTPGVQFGFDSVVGSDIYTSIAMRGVIDRRGSTTGIYLDEVQIPPARGNTYVRSFPFTFDLARVEVLRGPQSTLLGENVEGGAIRFITNQPSLTTFSGLAHSEWATTEYGAESYEAGVAFGGPVIRDALGIRVSGWYRTDGGYVDRIDPHTKEIFPDSNRYVSEGARGAVLIAPAEGLQITPALAYQSLQIRDPSALFLDLSQPTDGLFRNESPVGQPSKDTWWIASLKFAANTHGTHVDAVSSYFDRHLYLPIGIGSPVAPVPDYAATVLTHNSLTERVFSQEVRLSSSADSRVSWIAGASYSTARSVEANEAPAPISKNNATDTTETQFAVFGQLDLRVTSRFTATAGVRIGRDHYDAVTEQTPVQSASSVDTWATPRFVLSYEPAAGGLIYLSAAKGHRSAGAYPALSYCLNTLQAYPPGSVWSYEIGTKNELSGGRVRVDASAFHVRWNNGQQPLGDPCNAADQWGTSTSNGFDVTVDSLLAEHLTARLAVAYADARYTQTLELDGEPAIRKGDALGIPPLLTAPWTVTAAIDRDFFPGGNLAISIRLEDVFRSHNSGPYMAAAANIAFGGNYGLADPSTNKLNVRATIRWASFEASVFVNNALGAQPTLGRQFPDPQKLTYGVGETFRPRTAGLSATWRF